MSQATAVNQTDFREKVLEAEELVVVDFFAPRCPPCRAIAPVIDELASEYANRVTFLKADVDQNPTLASMYSVKGIPTLMVFRCGTPLNQVTGFKAKPDIKCFIDSVLDCP